MRYTKIFLHIYTYWYIVECDTQWRAWPHSRGHYDKVNNSFVQLVFEWEFRLNANPPNIISTSLRFQSLRRHMQHISLTSQQWLCTTARTSLLETSQPLDSVLSSNSLERRIAPKGTSSHFAVFLIGNCGVFKWNVCHNF